jgi:primosomal protein N' (replication factor Y)
MLTIRAFLPPGLLERLVLTVEAAPGAEAGLDEPADAAVVAQLAGRRRAVRSIRSDEGRPSLLRRIRSLDRRGLVHLDWTLEAAGAGPRYVRWLLPARDEESGAVIDDAPAGARRLGPRTAAALAELVAIGDSGIDAPALVGRHGAAGVATLVRRGLARVETREAPRRPLGGRPPPRRAARPPGTELTPDQARALAEIGAACRQRDSTPFLLSGVTGAGKTAVYREAIAVALDLGRRCLVLVPEVGHALVLADRLRADLDAEVALIHSGLSDGERADEWRRIRAGDADVVVGTRLAVAAPLESLGLVVVDEEHDPAYKSDRTPRLQARDAAIALARLAGAACVLGSATPSVESEGRARDGTYRRVSLPDRAVGEGAPVEVVDLRAELAAGNRRLLSRRLQEALGAIDPTVGDQAILVINRRGAASVVLCRDCGVSLTCPECGRALVFHQAGMTLRCHHCGLASPLPSRCPACASPRIRYLGGGTQRVEREVRESFPALRVGRLDRDVAERRGGADRVIEGFAAGRLDVLVGTSLVAKALDIPTVTLAAVVSADIALNLPDERAAERTYQLLVQAVGRAGRGERPSTAIVQTYQPQHPAIRAVATGDATAFYDAELAQRRAFGSPPFGRVVKLVVALPARDEASDAANAFAGELRRRAADRGHGVTVSGPAPAFVPRRAGRWRFIVVIRGTDPVAILDGGPPAPWSVDVDPESLL